PEARGDLAALAELQDSGRVVGVEDWLTTAIEPDANLTDIASELRAARAVADEIAASDRPDRVVALGADANAPSGAQGSTGRSFAVDVRRGEGTVERDGDVNGREPGVVRPSDIGRLPAKARDKVSTRRESGIPIDTPDTISRDVGFGGEARHTKGDMV